MKALALTGPNQLEILDLPSPEPDIGATLIDVQAVGLNRLDLMMFDGDISVPYPHVFGSDVVGRVVACPSGAFDAGDRVFVNPGLPEDASHGWGPSRHCQFVRILGLHVNGALSEGLVVGDEQVYLAPAHLSDEQLATIPLDYLTAWRMLVSRARVEPGEFVLVWGAAGPLGCAAIAICTLLGAHAIAAGSRQEDYQTLREIGAVAWADYTSPHFGDDVRAAAHGDVDIVFESVGAASWSQSLELVAPSGRIAISGTTSGSDGRTNLTDLYYKQVSVLGSRMGYPEEFEAMLAEVVAERLEPAPVAATFGMREAAAAFNQLATRERAGKIVLQNDL